jgi:cell division protein FtsW
MTREQADARMAERRRRMERREMQEMREQESRELAKGPIDLPFFLLVLLLTAIGLVMLFSASFPSAYYKIGKPTYYLTRQGVFAVMGFAVMILVSKINYQRFRGAAKPLLALSVMLLMLVLVPHVGITRNNATRWLGVGGSLTFQPSEIAKLAVVVCISQIPSPKSDIRCRPSAMAWCRMLVILGLIAMLMLMEPHLSGTVPDSLATGVVLMLVGGIEGKWLVGLGVLRHRRGAGVLVC